MRLSLRSGVCWKTAWISAFSFAFASGEASSAIAGRPVPTRMRPGTPRSSPNKKRLIRHLPTRSNLGLPALQTMVDGATTTRGCGHTHLMHVRALCGWLAVAAVFDGCATSEGDPAGSGGSGAGAETTGTSGSSGTTNGSDTTGTASTTGRGGTTGTAGTTGRGG